MCSISIKPSNKEPIAKAVGSFFAQKKSRRVAHTTNIVLRRVLRCTCVAQQCANVGSAGKLQFWSIVGENAVVLPFIVAARPFLVLLTAS